jgi:hypothetical protein
MTKDSNGKDKTESEEVELIFGSYEGRKTTAVQLPWHKSKHSVASQSAFYDSILALAELPPPMELPKILAISQQTNVPSIWQRVRASSLESNAAALLTALAFSRKDHQNYIVDQFLKAHDLCVDLRGRPPVNPRKTMAFVRGIQIEKIMQQFQVGFEIVDQARRKGDSSRDAAITAELKRKGYDDRAVETLLNAKSLQDAACKHFVAGDRNLRGQKGALKLAQNAIAIYKKMYATQIRS